MYALITFDPSEDEFGLFSTDQGFITLSFSIVPCVLSDYPNHSILLAGSYSRCMLHDLFAFVGNDNGSNKSKSGSLYDEYR